LVSQIYFYQKTQPEVRDAFSKYLESIESIERIETVEHSETYEAGSSDIGTLIDDIFIKVDEVNKLFQHRFNCRLFCTPLSSQSTLNKATKVKMINLPSVIATVGLVINEICHQEIDKLLSS